MGDSSLGSILHYQRAAPSRRRVRAERLLAMMLITSTKAIRIRAAPQACACLTGSGLSEYRKIVTGMFGTACDGSVCTRSGKIEVVKRSGAVSPAARATASSAPVIMPLRAVGTTTESVVLQRLAPSASPASLTDSGTR